MSTKKMAVMPVGESTVFVQADRFESFGEDGRGVVLFVGQEIVALFPHIKSIVIEQPAEAPKSAVVDLAPGALVSFDPPPTFSHFTVNISGVTPDSAASIAAHIQGLMDRRQSPDLA